jgi:dihydrolipoamide dehydrogenase
VGLTARQAVDAGHRARTVDLDFSAAQGANLYADGYQGHARLVVVLDREVLLGVTFVGPGVSELLHSATIVVAGEVPLKRLRHTIACFPTVSEIWLFLLAAYQHDKERSQTSST